MASHAEELGLLLLDQRGSLTRDACKKAIEETADKIEHERREHEACEEITKLGYWLVLNRAQGAEFCMTELRDALLRIGGILRGKSPKNSAQANSDKA